MDHVMIGILSSLVSKERSQFSKTHLQKKQQDKNMSKLDLHLNNIKNARFDEYPWVRSGMTSEDGVVQKEIRVGNVYTLIVPKL